MLSTQDKIKHLSWRGGFGLSPKEWKEIKNWSFESYVQHLFTKANRAKHLSNDYAERNREALKKMSPEERKRAIKEDRALVRTLNAEWVTRMASAEESALLEKMCLFWHGHFACVSKSAKLASKQLITIRTHALGNFRAFVQAMAKDVSMIRFLNNQQNKKSQPNENFARELMELFTIGRGHYTERDIKEAARAFTGWSSDLKGDFKFRRRQHDFENKSFMGKEGAFNGDDIINIILDRKETAVFISRKIYRFFVNETLDEKRVSAMADRFYQSDYDIADLIRYIFLSDWFYERKNVGTQIKSPVVLLAGLMRSLEVQFEDTFPVLFVEKALGQTLFIPPNVAGWPGGKNWIDNSTLMLRLNLVAYLFNAADLNFKVKEAFEAQKRNKAIRKIKAKINLNPLLNLPSGLQRQLFFEELSAFLLASKPELSLKEIAPYLDQSSEKKFRASLVMRLMSLPEYQVC